mmetsp:Transcript_449/g.1406  ORF Transcript_449/g.1406 Transcript_449/m.1406 type:complete len:246 (+) Transcript_449:539-1276(+)
MHPIECLRRDRVRDLSTLRKNRANMSWVAPKPVDLDPDRANALGEDLRQLALELGDHLAVEASEDLLTRLVGEDRNEAHHVPHLGASLCSVVERDGAKRVGFGLAHLGSNLICAISHKDPRVCRGVRLAHLLPAVAEAHHALDARPRKNGLRLCEEVHIVLVVHAPRDRAREFEMLRLVITDGDVRGLVEKNVCRHQRWVREEAEICVVLAILARLLLELRHAIEPAHWRVALQDPRQLGVARDG